MNTLGVNGLGRIGKLLVWNQLSLNYFDRFIINLGREMGSTLEDFIHFFTNDSTYGDLSRFLYGYSKQNCEIEIVDREKNIITIDKKEVQLLVEERNPGSIKWDDHKVDLVVDCTGVFLDPTKDSGHHKGSVRGHLNGAKKVICSAPFKGKEKTEDSNVIVFGINEETYNPEKHHIISSASCTTTGLSHMMKPLLENEKSKHIKTVSMSTIHAATNNQNILDAVPKSGANDLRRNRSVFNNIIVTSTGAAKALKEVLPEVGEIPFIADSIRIPTNTVSLITLNLTIEGELKSEEINKIYKEHAESGPQKELLCYSETQNVSSDIRGKKASVVIEGIETTTKVVEIDGKKVTHAKILGWYDNEFGNYVNSLSKLAIMVKKAI